jgi:phosphoglycolate phosphatase-like HAD superfamily hydrolase
MEGESHLKLRDYAAYIFDLDGTLFMVPVDWAKVREEVGRMVGEPLGTLPLFQKVEQFSTVRPSLKAPLFAMLDSHELKAVAGAAPLDGATELLSSLSKVAKLGLVTMQGTATCDRILGRHRLGELFDAIVTREDSLDRAAQLRAALKSLGVAPGEALFTGDRLNDIVCGRRVGVDVVLVGSETFGDVKPNFTFPNLLQLKESAL